MPNQVFAGPGSWLDHDRLRLASRGREYQDRLTDSMRMRHTASGGAWGELDLFTRPSTSSRPVPAGGASQGPRDLRPRTSAAEYDPAKHGWYHPCGQAEMARLADQKQKNSWAWTMHKARDHNGYGEDGLVDARDIQITAVSGDTPDWFLGTRTLAGPLSTKKHPVRRCPFVQIDGKTVRVQAKTYAQGDGMGAIESLHDRNTPPTPVPIIRAPRYDDMESKATRCNLELGGCQGRPEVLPSCGHVSYDTVEPPRMRRMARR